MSNSAHITFTRDEWSKLAASAQLPLVEAELESLASLGDPVNLEEADAIYRPLAALMEMYWHNTGELFDESREFLGFQTPRTPWIVAIAGSVSVGKSTTARLLRKLLSRFPDTPNVALVPTDGFLRPNAVLEERGILNRKGFPESYDRSALLKFLGAVKSGTERVEVPVYDHLSYDIVPGETITIERPDILIVEGLNVLQPARLSRDGMYHGYGAVSDYFDFTIYLDAPEDLLEEWYVNRFLRFRSTAFSDPKSYFQAYAGLSDEEADRIAREVWHAINLPNLRENIVPTRSRAKVILHKGEDHRIEQIRLRKL